MSIIHDGLQEILDQPKMPQMLSIVSVHISQLWPAASWKLPPVHTRLTTMSDRDLWSPQPQALVYANGPSPQRSNNGPHNGLGNQEPAYSRQPVPQFNSPSMDQHQRGHANDYFGASNIPFAIYDQARERAQASPSSRRRRSRRSNISPQYGPPTPDYVYFSCYCGARLQAPVCDDHYEQNRQTWW